MLDLFGIQKRRRRRELWQQLATELGGAFHLAEGWWKRKNERVEAVVDGVAVVLETYVISTGKSSQAFTRVTAPYLRGPGPKMQVSKHGVLASIGNALGMTDVAIGDATFDRDLVVRSADAAVVRRLWTARAMEEMARFLDTKLTSDAHKIQIVGTGVWDEERRLRASIAMIAELAARDLYGVETLRAIEGAMVSLDERSRPFAELAAPVRVVVAATELAGQLVMRAHATEKVAHESFTLEIVGGNARDTERASKLPPGAHIALRGAGTGTLACDEHVLAFTWGTVDVAARELRAGAELLGAIAAAVDATAYR